MNLSTSQSIDLNVKYIGPDKITGKTIFKDDGKFLDEPFCNVHLFDQNTNEYLATAKSNNNSLYSFDNLNLSKHCFFVVAHKKDKTMNGSVADNIGYVSDVDN